DQNDVASKPPISASGPFVPRPVLRAYTMSGLRARTSATSMPRRRRTPLRKLVRNTSADSTSLSSASRPSSCLRLIAAARLLWLKMWYRWLTPAGGVATPQIVPPRMMSPCSGSSTLITSAPQSARMLPAIGTAPCDDTSSTRYPRRSSTVTPSPLHYFRPTISAHLVHGDGARKPVGEVRPVGIGGPGAHRVADPRRPPLHREHERHLALPVDRVGDLIAVRRVQHDAVVVEHEHAVAPEDREQLRRAHRR